MKQVIVYKRKQYFFLCCCISLFSLTGCAPKDAFPDAEKQEAYAEEVLPSTNESVVLVASAKELPPVSNWKSVVSTPREKVPVKPPLLEKEQSVNMEVHPTPVFSSLQACTENKLTDIPVLEPAILRLTPVVNLPEPTILSSRKIDRGIRLITFVPKGQWMIGGTLSYSAEGAGDYKFLILKNIENKSYSYKLSPSFCYFFRDNLAVGARFSYKQNEIDLANMDINLSEDFSFQIEDAYNFERMLYGTVFLRSYMNLGDNKRFGLFNEAQVSFGMGNGTAFSGTGETFDETTQTIKHLQIGMVPGLTAFITNNVAVEVSVGVMGFSSKWIDQTHNGFLEGHRRVSSAKFKIDLLSIDLGMTCYF